MGVASSTPKKKKVLMLGLDNSGKTTILYMLRGGSQGYQYPPTMGFNIEIIKHKNFNLRIWDIGGLAALRQQWKIYYTPDTDAVIFVIDCMDKSRFDHPWYGSYGDLLYDEHVKGCNMIIKGYVHRMQHYSIIVPQSLLDLIMEYFLDIGENESSALWEFNQLLDVEELKDCPILIYANKQGFTDAIRPKEIEEKFGLSNISKNERKLHVQPCQGQSGQGLWKGLDWMISHI